MRTTSLRKSIVAVMTGLFLVSAGAVAADKHDCKSGTKWDETKKECVKEAK